MRRFGRFVIASIAVALAGAMAVPAAASAFVAWRVSGVSADDVLMVRAYPSPRSKILVGYPDGVTLSMTGRCTGGANLLDIQMLPTWKQRQMVAGQWCELWLDPYGTGEFRNGWVSARYLSPA